MTHAPLDVSLFRWVDSQTTVEDRRALLSLREAVCQSAAGYRYLEVGSHLGGSLQPHVIDGRCLSIVSIDPRPAEQPDDRWRAKYQYEGNSTGRMLALLTAIPGADVSKIRTFEKSSWELSPAAVAPPADLAFIDGEHTNAAVWRDFQAVRRYLAKSSVLAFHDCYVTPYAMLKMKRWLAREPGINSTFLHYPASAVVAIVFESSETSGRLLAQGWTREVPGSYRSAVKVFARKHFPKVVSSLPKWLR